MSRPLWQDSCRVSVRSIRQPHFDTQGRFAIQSTGLQGEVASSQYDPTLGVVLSQTDANGLTVRYGYDAFGRQVWQRSPNGNLAQTARVFADATQTDIEVTQTATGAPTQTERFNAQGLKLWSRTQGFDGRTIQVDYGYDANLRLIKQSAPYFHGTVAASIGYTQSYYDLLDRSIQVSVVDPSKGISLAPETLTYRPNLQIQRKQGREHWTYVNALGQITSVETRTHATEQVCQEYAADTATGEPTCKQFAPKASLSGWVDYRYDAAGNQIRVYSPNTETAAVASQGARVTRAPGDYNEIVLEYDLQGRKTRLQDPDKGGVLGKAWTYSYSAYGELIKQVDAKGQTTELEYDTYGQLVRRLRRHATGAAIEMQTACWSYGASRGQFGQTLSVRQYGKSVACTTTEAPDYAEHFRYDSLGRPQTTETEALIYQAQRDAQGKVIKNAQGQDQYAATRERFYSGQAYNSLGQLVRQDYPNGFSVNRVYSSQGYLSELRDSDTNQSYLTVTAMNARGAVTGHRLGNGVQVSQVFNEATGLQTGVMAGASGSLFNEAYRYDGRGNLSSRTDTVQGRIEALNYDAHNRLVLSTSWKNNAPELSLRYAYDTQGNMLQRGKTLYAACKTFSTVNNVKVCTQWAGTNQNLTSYYRYKANVVESLAGPHAVRGLSGDETASFNYDANGNQLQGTTANTYNLADQLVKAVKGTTQVEFAYAPDGDRYLRVDTVQGKRQLTFSQGGYERVDDELNRTHKYSVGGVVLITEQETWTNPNSYVRDLTYLVKDYLGSVRLELDSQGKERSRMRYSAFGEQYSDPLNGLITSGARIELNRLQNRGYTGHEEIAALGLIHMNGRVYDPKLGRFLQADPFVQDATSLQALNRYSYVENNPFAATDPSGFSLSKLWKKIKPFIGIIITVVAIVVSGGAAGPAASIFLNNAWAAAGLGAVAGGVSAGVNGGNILQGALIGGITAAAFYGVGKGMESLARAKYAAASTGWKATWIGAHAVTGGTLAKVQGGQFRNGFISAGISKGVDGYLNFGKGGGAMALETAAVAVVGGTTSQLTGGKFANGAETAAFAHLFNEAVSTAQEKLKQIRLSIAESARSKEGSELYLKSSEYGTGSGKYKCTYMVHDSIVDAGISLPLQDQGFSKYIPFFGEKNSPYIASQWYEQDVPGVAMSIFPSPGDVASVTFDSDVASGHAGVVGYNDRGQIGVYNASGDKPVKWSSFNEFSGGVDRNGVIVHRSNNPIHFSRFYGD